MRKEHFLLQQSIAIDDFMWGKKGIDPYVALFLFFFSETNQLREHSLQCSLQYVDAWGHMYIVYKYLLQWLQTYSARCIQVLSSPIFVFRNIS